MRATLFWDMTPCLLVICNRSYGRAGCLHRQGNRRKISCNQPPTVNKSLGLLWRWKERAPRNCPYQTNQHCVIHQILRSPNTVLLWRWHLLLRTNVFLASFTPFWEVRIPPTLAYCTHHSIHIYNTSPLTSPAPCTLFSNGFPLEL